MGKRRDVGDEGLNEFSILIIVIPPFGNGSFGADL